MCRKIVEKLDQREYQPEPLKGETDVVDEVDDRYDPIEFADIDDKF